MKKTIVFFLALAGTALGQVATFESGFDGFSVGFDADTSVALSTDIASEGSQSFAFTNSGNAFRWTGQFNPDTTVMEGCVSADPSGSIVFDFMATDNTANWSQLFVSGNSDVAPGWTQYDNVLGGTPTPNVVNTLSYSYADLGWSPGEGFYQMNFAINYGDDNGAPLTFYIDNVRLDTTATNAQCAFVPVPEPASFGLVPLAVAGGFLFRRR